MVQLCAGDWGARQNDVATVAHDMPVLTERHKATMIGERTVSLAFWSALHSSRATGTYLQTKQESIRSFHRGRGTSILPKQIRIDSAVKKIDCCGLNFVGVSRLLESFPTS